MARSIEWRAAVKDALARVTGYRLVRDDSVVAKRGLARPPMRMNYDRLLPSPVFLLSSVRSGSTLLRAVLNSHPQIHSPHETHFRRLQVLATRQPVLHALAEADLTLVEVEHLLWDRLLHRSLQASGKRILVEKTPSNVFVVDRLMTAWPQARIIYLIRHPLSIARSWNAADPRRRPMRKTIPHTLAYMEHVEQARQRYPGVTVRYEDLTTDPVGETRRLCAFLGVEWDAAMLDYGQADHGSFEAGIGDWSDNIRSGTIQVARPLPVPAEVPPQLAGVAVAWGYLD